MPAGRPAWWTLRALLLLLLVLVMFATAVEANKKLAPPRLVANAPAFIYLPYRESTRLSPIISGARLDLQWEFRWSHEIKEVWRPIKGATSQSLELKFPCGVPEWKRPVYRLVAANPAGRVVTRPTKVLTMVAWPRFLARPQPVVTRVAGRAPSVKLSWVVAPEGSADTAVLTVSVSPGPRAPVRKRYRRRAITSLKNGPLRLTVSLPQRQVWNGTVLSPFLKMSCNSTISKVAPDRILSPYDVELRILPASASLPRKVSACPVDAVNVNYGGWVIRNGNASPRLPSCADCRALCAKTVGCDTWVYGADKDTDQAGQCWLKAQTKVGLPKPVVDDASPTSPWMSGKMPNYESCGGLYGNNLRGTVLVRGDVNLQPDCLACAEACEKLPGCNVWAWGYLPSSRHYRQCTLKWTAWPKEWSLSPDSGPNSPWVSGDAA